MADRPTARGPVQLLVIAFEDGTFEGRILAELRRLREHDAVRLIDLLFVAKDELGDVVELEQSELSAEEATGFGALIEALIGLGSDVPDEGVAATVPGAVSAARNGWPAAPDGAWFLADAIPAGTSAAVALIEHRWAIPLRDAVESAGGHDLIDRWIHPEDLAAIGATGN